MLKIIIGNALMGILIGIWWNRHQAQGPQVIEGMIFIAAAFIVGAICGAWSATQRPHARKMTLTQADDITRRLEQL